MDKQISEWFLEHAHGNEIINQVMKWVSTITEMGILWIVVILSLFFYQWIRHKKLHFPLLMMLGVMLLGWLVNDMVLKVIFDRARPCQQIEGFYAFMDAIGYKYPTSHSFPSGHSFSSLEAAVMLTFYRKKIGYIAIPFALLVGFSRIFLGAHFLSDVIAGLSLGALFALGFIVSVLHFRKKGSKAFLCD